jgi:metal-responsive CopG/Arc/MetJ family transcriptional regulator
MRLHYIRMTEEETLTENIQVRMKPNLIKKLETYADKNGFKDRSELIRHFCHMGLQQSPGLVKYLFKGD